MTRVEFRSCRLSGLQAPTGTFSDVGFVDSKLDGGNCRMTTWTRAELIDSDLSDSDFSSAALPGSHVLRCNLTAAQFSKSDLTGSRIVGSKVDGLRGAESLRGVTIGSDEVIPVALAIFGALGIAVDDS